MSTGYIADPLPWQSFGSNETCTLDTCPIESSILTYRVSLAATIPFIAFYAVVAIIQIVEGIKWKSWFFTTAMLLGILTEVIGYIGRIMMYSNPFTFPGFMIQIVCLTIAPVFFSAAIYTTLSKITIYLGVEYSRFSPSLFYWLFIPCDIISIALQGAGGGLSTGAAGQTGVNVSLAGLSFQVVTLTVFAAMALDYAWRYHRGTVVSKSLGGRSGNPPSTMFKVFIFFLTLAILLIYIRCAYRIDELSAGYSGAQFHDEGLFIGLESTIILIAAFALCVAHPHIGMGDVPSGALGVGHIEKDINETSD